MATINDEIVFTVDATEAGKVLDGLELQVDRILAKLERIVELATLAMPLAGPENA